MNNEKVQAAMDDLKVKQDLFLLSKLEEEYNELSDKCNKLYTFIYSLDFVNKVPDCNERCLMQEQLKRMESYRIKLYQRIDLYRCRVKANNPEPWEKDEAARTVETLCGPVRRVSHDEQHHCGQDASCPVGDGSAAVEKPHIPKSFKRLVGMQVVAVNDVHCSKCVCGAGYTPSGYPLPECVKIELVGGYYLCLADLPNSIVTE